MENYGPNPILSQLTTVAPKHPSTTEEKMMQGNANTNPCSANSCNEGGICVPGKFESFECICFRGYSGKFCEVKIFISNSNQKKIERLITTTPTPVVSSFSPIESFSNDIKKNDFQQVKNKPNPSNDFKSNH